MTAGMALGLFGVWLSGGQPTGGFSHRSIPSRPIFSNGHLGGPSVPQLLGGDAFLVGHGLVRTGRRRGLVGHSGRGGNGLALCIGVYSHEGTQNACPPARF